MFDEFEAASFLMLSVPFTIFLAAWWSADKERRSVHEAPLPP